MHPIVYHSGPIPCPIMCIGEAPGRYESNVGQPFVGPSGEILSMCLAHAGANGPYHRAGVYLTNLCKEYSDGNPDPTPDQIIYWTDYLRDEILRVRPKVILAIGRYAAWWLLGGWHKWPMRTIHGRVCRGGELYRDDEIDDIDKYPEFVTASIAGIAGDFNQLIDAGNLRADYLSRANGALVIPCMHPATALPDRDPKGSAAAVVYNDIDVAIRAYEQLVAGAPIESLTVNRDSISTPPIYVDATGSDVANYIETFTADVRAIAIDTEDDRGNRPWSIQICSEPGYALTLRADAPDVEYGLRAIQHVIDAGYLIIVHFAIHDLPVMRALGLDTSNINLADTGYMLYLLHEPQSLKIASWRHLGVRMSEYSEVVGDVGRAAQLKYLLDVVMRQYPSPGKFTCHLNNGTSTTYRPQNMSTKAKKILDAVGDGKNVDIWERWHTLSGASADHDRILKRLHRQATEDIGQMPRGYLSDIYSSAQGREQAVAYASRDADMTYRLYHKLLPLLVERGLV